MWTTQSTLRMYWCGALWTLALPALMTAEHWYTTLSVLHFFSASLCDSRESVALSAACQMTVNSHLSCQEAPASFSEMEETSWVITARLSLNITFCHSNFALCVPSPFMNSGNNSSGSWAEFNDEGKHWNVGLIKCWRVEHSSGFPTIKISSRKALTLYILHSLALCHSCVSFSIGRGDRSFRFQRGPSHSSMLLAKGQKGSWLFSIPKITNELSPVEQCVSSPPEGSHALCCVRDRIASLTKTVKVQEKLCNPPGIVIPPDYSAFAS